MNNRQVKGSKADAFLRKKATELQIAAQKDRSGSYTKNLAATIYGLVIKTTGAMKRHQRPCRKAHLEKLIRYQKIAIG